MDASHSTFGTNAVIGVLRVVDQLDLLDNGLTVSAGRPVRDDNLQRIEHCHAA